MPSSSGRAMTLAKLSFRPSTTQVARVSRPDSTSGARVISTSPARRSTKISRMMMAMKDSTPASTKAPTMVRPDSRIEMGAPVASGATASTGVAESGTARRDRCWCPWGRPGCGRCRPAATQSPFIVGGMVASVTFSGVSEADNCPAWSAGPAPGPRWRGRDWPAGPAFASGVQRGGQAARILRRASCRFFGGGAQLGRRGARLAAISASLGGGLTSNGLSVGPEQICWRRRSAPAFCPGPRE